jgi:hypothetical protein
MDSPGFRDAQLLAAARHHAGGPVHRNVVDAAERELQRWSHQQQYSNAGAAARGGPHAMGVGPYLTISRECGTGASSIARLVGEAVDWAVFDRELLEFVAEKYHTSPTKLKYVDETTTNWISQLMDSLIAPSSVSQLQYVHRVSRVILRAARAGKAIFVGRSAQFLLPRENGLRVRLIAPLEYRIERIMEWIQLTRREARKYIAAIDAGRQHYCRQYFRHDAADPHYYDLEINVERLGAEGAAHVIVNTLSWRFP